MRTLFTRIVVWLAVAGAVIGAQAAANSADAVIQLLNSRAAGSYRVYSEAAETVAKEAAAGRPLHQFVLAVVSTDPAAPEAAQIPADTRARYLEQSRDKIRALAEKRGNSFAWYLLALETNDPKLFKRAAEGGNVQAMNAWGTYSLTQALSDSALDPEERDRIVRRAFGYFKDAADQKDANGMYNLGMCYQNGYGVEPDADRAFDCFRAAAELGHPEAINNIGAFYRDGVVVERDVAIATKWFARSAAMRNAYGELNYALALQRGEGVAQDFKRAADLLRDAAARGNPEAMNAYGMTCFLGEGVAQSDEEALNWFRRAAEQGNALAMENIAACYDQGRGVKKNVAMGTVWKIRARAARGDRHAAAWLRQNGHSLK